MLFSIILPVYNVEKYLKTCVESILKQTFQDYEIILVDDGSTDNSPMICNELQKSDKRIKVLHKKNGGLSDARNEGTRIARGKYIIYIDSDDFLISDEFLQKVYEKTEKDTDVIFYKYVKYFDSLDRMGECGFSYKRAMDTISYQEKIKVLVEDDAFFGMAWIKAIKRKVIENSNIQFEVGLLGEDMEWNYHIICNSNSIELIDEPFLAYRQREGSITSTHKLKNLTDFIYVLKKWSEKIKYEEKDVEFQKALYGSLAKYYSNLLVVYARLSDSKKREYKKKIKNLDWLLEYSLSRRPQMIKEVYRIVGFDLTIIALKILDRIR